MKQSQARLYDRGTACLGDPERNQGNGAQIQLLQEAAYGYFRGPLLILQGAVASSPDRLANVAGLLLARAASRRTEVAVRTALGAAAAESSGSYY